MGTSQKISRSLAGMGRGLLRGASVGSGSQVSRRGVVGDLKPPQPAGWPWASHLVTLVFDVTARKWFWKMMVMLATVMLTAMMIKELAERPLVTVKMVSAVAVVVMMK